MHVHVTTGSGGLDKEAAVRLACLNMIMEHGSNEDRAKVITKAADMVAFVLGTSAGTDNKKTGGK
jgi:hypothetical protein